MVDQHALRSSGRDLIGSILRELRKEAGLATNFASALKIQASMVRMIEAGHADVPVAKIPAYAGALNARAAPGGPFIDAEGLALAYMSLRSVDVSYSAKDRFNWPALLENHEQAKIYLRLQLTRKTVYANEQQAQVATDFDALNPIQLQLLKDIAQRVAAFGSDIVTDEAIASWENANSKRIRSVLAAVTCLASELSGDFFESIGAIAATSQFKNFQYLIGSEDQSIVDDAWKRLKGEVIKNTPSDRKTVVWSKFQYVRISTQEFEEIGRAVGSTESRGWDAFYLYELESDSGLMVGVFRRLPPLRKEVSALTLENWEAVPMNETLPWNSVSAFRTVHQKFWRNRHLISRTSKRKT